MSHIHPHDQHPELDYLDKMGLLPEALAGIKDARIEAQEIMAQLGSIHIDGWSVLLEFLEDALYQARRNERVSRKNYSRKEFTDFPDVPATQREETIRQLSRWKEIRSYVRFKMAILVFFCENVFLHPTMDSNMCINDATRTVTLELW